MPGRRRQGGFGGTGSGIGTLQQSYNALAASPQTINLDATRLGVLIKDAAVTVGGVLFGVQNSTGQAIFNVSGTAAVSSIFMGNGNIELRNTVASSELDFFIGGTARFYGTGSTFSPYTDLSAVSLGAPTFRWGAIYGGALSSGAAQALTITGSATSIWSLSTGNLSLDAAGSLSVGPTNATTVIIGRATQQTQIPSGLQLNNRVTVADAPYTANAYDCIIEFTSLSANRTVTFPNATAGNTGQIYIVKKNVNTSVNNILFTTTGGAQTVETGTTYTPATNNPFSGWMWYSTGTGYLLISDKGSLT